MNFDAFIAAINWTQAYWNTRRFAGPPYQMLRARGNAYWLRLDTLPRNNLENDVITGFLNKWGCRLYAPSHPCGIRMVNNLQQVLNRLPTRYAALHNIRIEGPALGQNATMVAVADIYHDFRGIRPKWGPVPSSKLMHMALPDLFMMWDDAIIGEYHVPKETIPGIGRRWSYAAFLLLMHENIQHIRATSPGGVGLAYPQFLAAINQQCGFAAYPLPITRLLDIANFAVSAGSRGIPIPPGLNFAQCQQCRAGAQVRLAGLVAYSLRFRPGRF